MTNELDHLFASAGVHRDVLACGVFTELPLPCLHLRSPQGHRKVLGQVKALLSSSFSFRGGSGSDGNAASGPSFGALSMASGASMAASNSASLARSSMNDVNGYVFGRVRAWDCEHIKGLFTFRLIGNCRGCGN